MSKATKSKVGDKRSMNQLAAKISDVIKGEPHENIFTVCCVLIGVSIANTGGNRKIATKAAVGLIKHGYRSSKRFQQ